MASRSMSAFSLDGARESAWESATSLANAKAPFERERAMALIGIRAAAVARLLCAPSLNPVLIGVCRKLESGSSWIQMLASERQDTGRAVLPFRPATGVAAGPQDRPSLRVGCGGQDAPIGQQRRRLGTEVREHASLHDRLAYEAALLQHALRRAVIGMAAGG